MIRKGVILAGGEGKRLKSLGLSTPKPLVSVNDAPLINFNLGLFARHGLGEVKIIIRPIDRDHYRAWRARYEKDFPSTRLDIVEESEPMGTFGYIFRHLRGWMGEDDIAVTNGDDIKEIDLRQMHDYHRQAGTPATVALMHMEDPADYGAVIVKDGKVMEYIEKRPNLPPGFVSAGLYVISSRALNEAADRIPNDENFLMFETHFFPALSAKKKLAGFICKGRFFDCGTPERLREAENSLDALAISLDRRMRRSGE